VSAVFPAQSNVTSSSACELMLRGRVTYGFRKGGEASKQWGGYARLVSGADGGWKFAEYQVYLVGSCTGSLCGACHADYRSTGYWQLMAEGWFLTCYAISEGDGTEWHSL
jgi:hypothetical protein